MADRIYYNTQAGTPTDKPKRITQWAGSGIDWLTASADGKRLTFLKAAYQAQVYLGELAAGGTRINPPRRLTNDDASDNPTAWTPDNKAVLFQSDRSGTWGIFKQGIGQDTAEPVVTAVQKIEGAGISADGAWILYQERPNTVGVSTPIRVMRIPVSGGVPQFAMEVREGGVLGYGCSRAPASLCVVLETAQDEKHLTVTAFDPLKGRGKTLRTIDKDPSASDGGADLSPDGSTLAVGKGREPEIHISLLSLSGDSDREITVKGWANLPWNALYWSPDGKGLYCGSVSPQSHTLLYVDLKGNARVLWQFKGQARSIWGVPSPDGRYLAIPSSVTNSNVWMLAGF